MTYFGDVIFKDLEKNEYLNKIYSTLLKNYGRNLISNEIRSEIDLSIELSHALRFADILSKSTDTKKQSYHKQLAQEIISLIRELYPEKQEVQQYLGSVLTNNGNYLGVDKNVPNYQSIDTIDRIFETIEKSECKIPNENNLYFSKMQKLIFDHFEEDSFSYSGPTSMGKSFLIKHFIKKKIHESPNNNFAFLVPTNALINELFTDLAFELQNTLSENNYKLVTITDSILLENENNHYIFILTPERFLYLLINKPSLQINYIFIDEAHKMIELDGRSSFYYKVIDCITKENRIKKPKIIFSSPNIPNPNIFQDSITNSSINKTNISVNLSPVNQFKLLIDYLNNECKIYNTINNSLEDLNVTPIEINSLILYQSNLLDNNVQNRKKTIVYCSSVSKTIKQAKEFYDTLPEMDFIPEELLEFSEELKEEISDKYYLVDFVKKGVAYHVGFLPNNIKQKLEKLLKNGLITVMFCTSTLLEGVNFPAKNLFVTSSKNGKTYLSPVDFNNLLGRVGRIQYNLFGNVFLINNQSDVKKYQKLLTTPIENQKLSVSNSKGISKKEKEYIVSLLEKGETSFPKHAVKRNQNENQYLLMKKVVNILLYDILNNNDSYIHKEFKPFLENKEGEIKKAFSNKKQFVDHDINISCSQVTSIRERIINFNLKYPSLIGRNRYERIIGFLEDLCIAFNWDETEPQFIGKTDENGKHNKIKFYATLINQWISEETISNIISNSINYYDGLLKKYHKGEISENKKPKIYLDGWKKVDYDGSDYHKNNIIASTLETLNHDILFTLNNYLIKFSKEYKELHSDESIQDWQQYIEFGTTNYRMIMLQKLGFSREASYYLLKNNYICFESNALKIDKSVFNCKKDSIKNECEVLRINIPELFK